MAAICLAPLRSAAPQDTGGFFENLLEVYTPRRACMNYESSVVWLHVSSDLLIAFSYFSIPIALMVFVRRRRDLAFNWMFQMFAMFIFACGVTHVVGVWDIWQPLYKVDGLIKLYTGVVSAATAVLLWRLIPAAVALPSPSELATVNAELAQMRDDLEVRVETRTRELAGATERERQSRDVAERANRAKDEFLATLSHELRTPLNAILGWTHLLSTDDLPDAERARGLEVISRNARAQSQLIEDLLDTSRIISGKLRLDVQETDLLAIIGAALETVAPSASAKGISLHRVLDPRAGPVKGDPERLQQVVWNLLSNAVKFTPKGGRVSVLLERVNSHVEISVVDNGPGMSPEVLPHVFDRFSQSDSSMTRRHSGLGLGLAIVRHLVELHGGTVHASNVVDGHGACFVVHLPLTPLQPDPETRVHPRASLGSPSTESFAGLLAGVRVLMVDDEADARQLVAIVLERAGAEVTMAGSAREALDLFAQVRPDVLLSDLGMPGEDGLSLMRAIRRIPADKGAAVRAIALSAFARPEDRRAALMAGFQRHLAKPVDPSELVLSVSSLVGRTWPGSNVSP